MTEFHATEQVKPPGRPPMTAHGAFLWARENLFGGALNTVLTLAALAAIVLLAPPLLNWLFFSATWSDVPSEVCRQNPEGACWAFVHEKYRLILFGRYPYDQQWRPLLGIVLVIALMGASCDRRSWGLRLVWMWVGGMLAFIGLMRGGFLGLQYVETPLWGGLPLTLLLSVVGVIVAFPLAILLALGRRSNLPLIRALCVVYIELIRGVPLITLLFMASFMLPLFLPTGTNINEVLRAQVAIIMFTAAYLAEVIRGGLQAIPKGQYEAADAIGLGYWPRTGLIIMPQAIRIVIPPIVNTYIGMFKDTSLVAIVGLTDLLLATRQAISDPEWRSFFVEGYIFIALIYFCFCYFMSKYSQYLEHELHGRTQR